MCDQAPLKPKTQQLETFNTESLIFHERIVSDGYRKLINTSADRSCICIGKVCSTKVKLLNIEVSINVLLHGGYVKILVQTYHHVHSCDINIKHTS